MPSSVTGSNDTPFPFRPLIVLHDSSESEDQTFLDWALAKLSHSPKLATQPRKTHNPTIKLTSTGTPALALTLTSHGPTALWPTGVGTA